MFKGGGLAASLPINAGVLMKKSVFFVLSLFIFSLSFAETVKLKDGTFINGSIVSQTEYTLNLNTSYGPVVLNQRDVESVLPDQHRIYLKGGTQLIGVILDLDEFNMVLQTDQGIVNIDMPQILSVEVYDYDQGASAQQAIADQQAKQQAAAASAAALQAGAAAASAQAAPVTAAGGLTFDADIEKVFDVKKPEIVNGQVQTVKEISAAEIRARRAQMSDEEAFLKGVNKAQTDEEAIVQTAEAARSGKLEQIKKAEAKRAKRPKDSASDKYFAITIGAQMNDLKLDNTDRAGFAGTDPYDVGGTGVRAEAAFLWRVKSSNLWLGPALAIANIPNSSFDDKDPAIEAANQDAYDKAENKDNVNYPYPPGSDLSVHTSGQAIDLLLKANYYFNPDDLFSIYLTASGGYRMLSLNYRGVIQSDTIDGNSFVGSVGIGTETHFDDMMLGLEVQEFFAPYSGSLKESSVANLVASVKFSWKF